MYGSELIFYRWDFGDGSPIVTGAQVYRSFPLISHPQAYKVVAWAHNDCMEYTSAQYEVLVGASNLSLPLVLKH